MRQKLTEINGIPLYFQHITPEEAQKRGSSVGGFWILGEREIHSGAEAIRLFQDEAAQGRLNSPAVVQNAAAWHQAVMEQQSKTMIAGLQQHLKQGQEQMAHLPEAVRRDYTNRIQDQIDALQNGLLKKAGLIVGAPASEADREALRRFAQTDARPVRQQTAHSPVSSALDQFDEAELEAALKRKRAQGQKRRSRARRRNQE